MLSEIVHTPESLLRHPFALMRLMWSDLLASRELAWRLMVRDISAQYRQALLGIAWAFAPPVAMAIGLTLARDAKVLAIGDTDIPYPAYVMFSVTLWQTFVEAISGPIQAVAQAKPMLARVNFPREALVLAKLGEVGFNFCIKLILIVGLFVYFRVPVSWSVFLAPVALFNLILLGTLVGVLLAPIGMLYLDISKSLNPITNFWLFLTPVIFPVPEAGIFGTLVSWNPVTPLLVTTRELATTGIVSNPGGFWLISGLTIVGVLATWVSFRIAMPYVVERVTS
ncbi:MAG: ABC transporter permease [Cyanobacteria bacterium J06642_2]